MSESETVTETVEEVEDVRPIAGIGTLVFGKWEHPASHARILDLRHTSTSQPWVFHTQVDVTQTLGSAKQSCLSLIVTSTNS